jgi:Integrase core domain
MMARNTFPRLLKGCVGYVVTLSRVTRGLRYGTRRRHQFTFVSSPSPLETVATLFRPFGVLRADPIFLRGLVTAWAQASPKPWTRSARHDIDHRLTKPKHPCTNGQVERMNRTIKDATVKRFHYETNDQLRPSRRLHHRLQLRAPAKDPAGPHSLIEYVCKIWTKEPTKFNVDPNF